MNSANAKITSCNIQEMHKGKAINSELILAAELGLLVASATSGCCQEKKKIVHARADAHTR